MGMIHYILLLLSMSKLGTSQNVQPTITRTELKVARSLDPEETQTLNVMTREGNVAQLIVKRRDPKSKHSTAQNIHHNFINQNNRKDEHNLKSPSHFTKDSYHNWIPVSTMYYPSNIIRLDTIALVRNASTERPFGSNLGNVIDSDRIPNVPRPITISSGDIFVKNSVDKKRGRSYLQVESDGIPVVHGVRVPDDESDRKTWRNARVINGELVPYEKDYKPPAAVPIGELIYASQIKDKTTAKNIGPFSKEDNFVPKSAKKGSFGPFTVKDNIGNEKPTQNKLTYSGYVRFGDAGGPFTKVDNMRLSDAKLIDYIKEINEKESKRDYFGRRKYRAFDETQQIQRRMLQYPGHQSYPDSAMYTPIKKLSPVTFTEGVRAPVLQYAHPELGVQPAKVSSDDDETIKRPYRSPGPYEVDSGRQSQYYDNNVNSIDYYRKDILNYPYNTYYIKKQDEQPFWIRMTESLKDNVQNGIQKMQQLTRPVFEPLVEATQKISHNLGFSTSPQRAQDKVGFIAPVSSSVLLPALGLVAGGAALGLGAAAVGRLFTVEQMRALQNAQTNLYRYNDIDPNDIVVIMEEPPRGVEEKGKRYKRGIAEEYKMQKIDETGTHNKHIGHLSSPHLWTDTPCSKKLFCEVMVRQGDDEVVLMEKKMEYLMSRVHPDVTAMVSDHLQDVMDAVKAKDCSKFVCTKKYVYPPTAA